MLATRIFEDLQCFGFVPVFFQPLEWHSCMQVCSGGREGRLRTQAGFAIQRDAPPGLGTNRGGETALTFGGGQVVSRSDMAAWSASAACVDSGPRAGGAGWANREALPEEAKARPRVEDESVLSDI